MEQQKYFKGFCLFALITVILYFFLTNDYITILQSLQIPFVQTYPKLNSILENITKINQTNNSIAERLSSPKQVFESRYADYYPRLPIHIYTHNVTLPGNTSKLILLGNGFFGSRNWGVNGADKSSTELVNSLHCPFLANRCDVITDLNRFSEADAVVYHMRDGVDRTRAKEKRRPEQRFVFALWESPPHTPNLQSFHDFFNWTMTYRFKSHIITSYYSGSAYVHTFSDYYKLLSHENSTGKFKIEATALDHRPSDEVLGKKKLGIAAALISNCGGSSNRLAFIKELNRFISVKIYGRCGESCPPKMNCRQFIAENFYFILSFENSLCSDYTTEKFFAAIEYPVVPVVLGGTNYSYFIPPSGFVDTTQFSTMISLAQHLNQTRYDKEKYLAYFSWKKDYVWGLSNFFTPFCDLCLRLHLDSIPNVINDMHKWWFDNSCQDAKIPKRK